MYSTTIFFFILAGFAVKSDDTSNYFVVQMPDEIYPKAAPSKTMQVYWNVPTIQCKSKRIPFDKLQERYGIIQNRQDSFRGDRVAIMYDPGYFPAIFKNASTGELVLRNGGVPQEGDLELHMMQFRKDVEHQIEDPNFDGIGIIDFESWRPIFRQNFGSLEPYQKLSCDIERQRHWWWPSEWIKAEATRRFEESARTFMQNTLSAAKQLRPKASWGYYGFPYCFNNPPHVATCAKQVPEENDRLYWLWSESTALYPSIYSVASLTAPQLSAFIKARVGEATRVARGTTPILPYWWFRYRDGGYFTQTDLNMALQTLHRSSASGFLIWGSSSNVNTPDKCHELLKYIENLLGPSIAKYTRSDSKVDELNDMEIYNDDGNGTFVVTNKPFEVDLVTEGMKSTIEIEANEDKDKEEDKTTTRDDFNVSRVGEIGILTSTTEIGAYISGYIVNNERRDEHFSTPSPIIRILSTSYEKDVTTSIPTEETVFIKEFSTIKDEQTTTTKIDAMQPATFTDEDYKEINGTNTENDEIFFNEEDFFDNADVFSSYEDINTSTSTSTISTNTEIQSTEDVVENTPSSFVSTTESPINDEQITVESFVTNTDDKPRRQNTERMTTGRFETSTFQYTAGALEITVSSTENLKIKEEYETETYLDENKQTEKSIDSTTTQIDTVSTFFDNELVTQPRVVVEKTKLKQDWKKSLLNADEEMNETFEDNETALKGDPTFMGLTSGVEQVLI